MTSKHVFGMLAVIALVALPATGAQAGSGGTPSALTSFFVCNSINGEDAERRVDVDSSSWAFNPKNVRIGNATLMCAFARLFPAGSTQHIPCPGVGCNEIDPNPGQDLAKQNLKCYSISVPRGQTHNSAPPTFTVTDQLSGTDTIAGSSIQYICAPASLTPNN